MVKWNDGERFSDEPQFGPRARPHPEERAGWSGPAKSHGRTRVSKDEDGRLGSPSAWRRIAARVGCGSACARRAAMLLSMRATVRGAFWPNEAKRGVCVFWSERSTNLRLYEMAAGSVSLFPDCYLQ